ncbi:hypothetical protein ACJIZ3_018385 [Penstemon smallii]|uniref:Uncharacterized protein n=1 Tax=Penstemon smallii TaxID=265156 RepID=A0ABD3SYT5_9LAMI
MKYKATLKTVEHGLSGEIDKTYIYSSPFSDITSPYNIEHGIFITFIKLVDDCYVLILF